MPKQQIVGKTTPYEYLRNASVLGSSESNKVSKSTDRFTPENGHILPELSLAYINDMLLKSAMQHCQLANTCFKTKPFSLMKCNQSLH